MAAVLLPGRIQTRVGSRITKLMQWLYNNLPISTLPSDCVGFVYLITCITTNKKYIGKKLAKFSKTTYRTVTLKNGTKKRKAIKTKVDSDWATYYGSSDALTKDILLHGEQCFTREILRYCKTKAECTYFEAKEQFSRGVLESNDYYNGQISCRIHKSHIQNKV